MFREAVKRSEDSIDIWAGRKGGGCIATAEKPVYAVDIQTSVLKYRWKMVREIF
ncbi:MAG: hypothetical protein ACLUUO_20645 [Sellimonas intestinalis]